MYTLRGVHYAHVTHMQITCYFSYVILGQHFQRSTIGYLSNSYAACSVTCTHTFLDFILALNKFYHG